VSVFCAYPTINILQCWDVIPEVGPTSVVDEMKMLDHDLRIVLGEIFSDNVKLRKQVDSLIRHYVQSVSSTSEGGEASQSTETVLKHILES